MVKEIGDAFKMSKDEKTFFRAVRPSSWIVDNYSFHGDIETIFNMTKETDNTWLFRRRFDVAAKRIVRISIVLKENCIKLSSINPWFQFCNNSCFVMYWVWCTIALVRFGNTIFMV